MGLLSGLESLGLGELDSVELYAEPEKVQKAKELDAHEQAKLLEADMLFDKSYVCPVCEAGFKSKTVRTGKARLIRTDMDLRPKYDALEPLKYEPVVCCNCGFAAVSRYFTGLAPTQKKLIKEKISANYKKQEYNGSVYTYEEAIERYRLSLVNAVVKLSRASEKAYICLKAGWTVRSYIETLEQAETPDMTLIEEMKALENEFITNAYEGYVTAVGQEQFPISGMDEHTINYLLASLALNLGHYDVSAKMISEILTNRNCSSRMKDKARDLKDILVEKIKEAKADK